MVILSIITLLVGCKDGDDEPGDSSSVSTEVKTKSIAVFDSNVGELPSYSTPIYEDDEYKYLMCVRNPKFELLILPYYKEDGVWKEAYIYDANKPVGSQLNPLKIHDKWLCTIEETHVAEASLENITSKITNFTSTPYLRIAPINYRNCMIGYLTVKGGKQVRIKYFCSSLNYNRTQGSSTFGYIKNVSLSYQFY